MLSIAIQSQWLIAASIASSIFYFLQFLCLMALISLTACYIWILAFLIDILFMSLLQDDHKVKHDELPRFSFDGCDYEPWVNPIRENIAVYLVSDVLTAEMTADSLDALLPANYYLKYPHAFVPSSVAFAWRLWETLVHFAFQIPHDHVGQEKLVSLIVALSERPAVLVRHENTLLRFWDAMPHYNDFIALYGNEFFFNDTWRHTGDKIHQTNLMAFLARVQATGLPHGEIFGEKWSFYLALHEKQLDTLPWAALWIKHCGEYLWWLVSQDSSHNSRLSKETWTNYMEQFGNIACDGRNGRYVRSLAQDAFRTMARLTASAPNPKFDNIGQRRWEAILEREGPQGVFEEPIAPDLWEEEEEVEEYEDDWWIFGDGEDPNGFHPLRPLGGYLAYSNVTEADERVIAQAA
ncbi:hypothetical protein N0V82_009252 [Gnomoniopsis sp. IMI 355080]|nr:hypothetical protein N0V82_009252 [Gnomoniopsis sp. IMI 355080]